jgi:exosortase D (VPLPA-CTERM-specific)
MGASMGKNTNILDSVDFAKIFKLGVYVILLLGIYYSALSWLVTHDWAKADFSYCYLIVPVGIYLVWDKRTELSRQSASPSWVGVGIIFVGVLFFWLGELAGEFFTIYFSFWMVLVGLCWLHLGWNKLKTILFPLVFLLAMFPFPNFLYNKISLKAKLISSQLGVNIMHAYGMSAYREGNVIDLGFTQLQVVDACSGLRYLFPLFIVGLVMAYFFKAKFWKRAVVVLSSIPLSIVTNSLRIAMTGILYEKWGAAVAEGFFHGFSGWFIFMFSFAVLLFEMWVLNKIFPEKDRGWEQEKGGGQKEAERVGEEGVDGGTPVSETGHDGKKGVVALFSPPQFVVAGILLLATLGLSYGVEFREKIPPNKSFARFPLEVGNWSGSRESMEQKFVETLDLSDYVIVDYRNQQGKTVNFYVAYYESQRKGESIHSPATCLPGGGWIFKEAGAATIPVPAYDGQPMEVNRAFMQKGAYKQLSYYWFPQRGRILTNAYELKLFTFWDALTKQRTDGALVRVITPVYESEDVADAEKRLQNFTAAITPVLKDYIPGQTIHPGRKNFYKAPIPPQ